MVVLKKLELTCWVHGVMEYWSDGVLKFDNKTDRIF